MPVIRTADIDTFYLDEGSGEPVVFVHGHTLDHRMWDAQVAPLLAAGYRVLRYDLRGHGQSSAPLVGYSPEDLAADLKALLDARGITAAHVVGLSRGGGVTLAFALAYPAATRTITLIDSVLPGYPLSDTMRATLRMHAERFAAGGKAAFLATWLTDDLFGPACRDPALAATLADIVQGFAAVEMTPDAITAMRERAATRPPLPPVAERLAEIDIPALVIVGELDTLDFQAAAAELVATLPRAQQVMVADAGHMANMEQPAVVNDALLQFLCDHA